MWFWQSDFIEKASNFKFYAIGTSFRKGRKYIIRQPEQGIAVFYVYAKTAVRLSVTAVGSCTAF